MLFCDFETKSACDLKKHGVYNYAQDRSTEVLCMSYAFDDDVQTWTPDQPFPDAVRNYKGSIRAHNATFERLIFWYVLGINFKLEQFYCTATQARANCLPGSLEDIGRAMSAKMKKDHRGKQLIRQCCVPPYNIALLPELIHYCEQDVRAMREVSLALRQLDADELRDYHINERINDRGLLIDVPLCHAAIGYATAELEDIQTLVKDITGIASARSPKLKQWVADRVDPELMMVEDKLSLNKATRSALLQLDLPDEVLDVVQCIDDISASSVAKFKRMGELADVEDHRVRGAFVFNGGSATGRASSYGVQLQNMARLCAKDPEAVRSAMMAGDDLGAFGSRVTDVLKGMIRPAIIPAPGNVLIVADWAGIEARCNPWLAKQPSSEAKLDIFRSGGDVYVENAKSTFNVKEVTKEQRFVGKVQELACFTEETKVLTHNGIKAILDVLITDKLWDGSSWVDHQGVILKGTKEVINVCGVNVTPNHLVLIKKNWLPIHQLNSNKFILFQALVTGSVNLPYWELKELNLGPALSIWRKYNAIVGQRLIMSIYQTLEKVAQHGVILALKNKLDFGVKIITNLRVFALMMRIVDGCLIGFQHVKEGVLTLKTKVIQIMGGGALHYIPYGKRINLHFCNMFLRLTAGINRNWNLIGLMSIRGMNLKILGSLLKKKIVTIKEKCRLCSHTLPNLKPVYDILNSGKNNRFTIVSDAGALIVHNCGYSGGVGAFASMSRIYGLVMSEERAKKMVRGWRVANPWCIPYGQELERAYMSAMRHKGHEFSAGRVTYLFDGNHLWYILPSGRILNYPFARIEDGAVTYLKAAFKPASDAVEWPRARLWQGIAQENCAQATANDLLRYSLRQLDGVIAHIHDEIVVECREDEAENITKRMTSSMCSAPVWADGLPLDVEIATMYRYGK